MTDRGLLLINTGNGKGKSTAAFGLALRAVGQGMKVCIIQFIKGKWQTGEAKAIKKAFGKEIELHIKGSGFTWEAKNMDAVRAAAREGLELAKEKMMGDSFDLVILDELTYLINLDLVAEEEILTLLMHRPQRLHVLLTGRNASKSLIEAADLVTEMQLVKHPFDKGIKAQKGIEF